MVYEWADGKMERGLHIYIIVESNIALIGGVIFNPIFDSLLSMVIFLGKKNASRA